MRSTNLRATLATLAAMVALVACSKDSTAPTQTIILSVPTQTLTVQCGSTASLSATLQRGGGFTGDVDVTVSGLPAAVTLDFTPDEFSGSTTTVTMNVFVDESVIEGTYTVTVTGSSSIGSASATFTLVIVEAPGFELSVAPAALTMPQGTSRTATVTITREGGFASGVALMLANPPAGIGGTFNPASTSGSTSTLTLVVDASVIPADYQLTIQGVATGLPTHTATLALTVIVPLDFTLAANPSALTVQRGGTGNTTIQITRSASFDGPVQLSVFYDSDEFSGTFAPTSPIGASATLTLMVAAWTAPGNYTVTIVGDAEGVPQRTTMLAVTVVEPPGFTLALNPSALAINRGTSSTSTVEIGRIGGFAGAITLSLIAPPDGISATFNPPAPTGAGSTMTLSVAGSVPAGPYTITVKGQGPGVLDVAATLQLTVTIAPAIELAFFPTTLQVPQWQAATSAVTLTRTNFTGDITLSATGAAPGISVTFNPQVVSYNSSTINVDVGLLVPVGTYDITIAASGAGVATVNRTLQVQVSQAPGTVVEYQFCSTTDRPSFFAMQDGTGPWKVVPPTEVGGIVRYRFPMASGYGGGAFVVPRLLGFAARARLGARPVMADAGTLYSSHYVFGTTADLLREGANWCEETLLTGTFTGTVQGYGAGEMAFIAMGTEWTTITSTSPANFALGEAVLGTRDLFATRRLANGTIDRFDIHRNINASQGGVLPLVDFNGPNSFAALTGNVTVNNALTDFLASTIVYTTANGNVGQIAAWSPWSMTPVRPYPMVPPAGRLAGDVMGVFARSSIGLPDREDDLRLVTTAVDPGAAAVTVTLGPRAPAATASAVATDPYLRFRVQGTLLPEYPTVVTVHFEPASGWTGAEGNIITLTATSDYLTTTGTGLAYDMTMPDLSGVAGFPIASALPRGEAWIQTRMWKLVGTTRINPNQPLTPGMQIFEGRTYRFQTF